MNNIYILNKNYKQIGVLSNQGANPQAPYYDDLYVQELDTGADTYQFSAVSSIYTQDLLEIGNHVMFSFNNRNEIFTITSLEYSHYEGYKTIGVYAEGIGFELLEVFMERPPIKKYPNSGNDSDGDGDDNTDDEYADPDDIYIDENGNIIYDKNGSGPPSADDVYIDDDGFIIYKPDKKKEKNDSLEFKNISFPTFLKILLKNTGWSFSCQSGLSSVKHSISVRYDTNIYAILQDSMQAYRGVELEFVHEMRNGKVQKIVKAYKDGGRGSVVGKRFEYGTNVRGITKTQEVADSEDDTILYVDNVGIDITYDVDFALKSVEVPEIEIGDTHYVIDKDFYPPMTIKARIGKIEISFTDPTKNKIYLANNKKIRGSLDEEEDIRDILDDYFGDDDMPGDDDIPGDDDDIPGDDDDIPDDIPGDVDLEDLTAIEVNTGLLTVPLDNYDGVKFGVPDEGIYSGGVFIDKQDLLEFIMNEINICTHIHSTVVAKYRRQGIPNFTDQRYLGIEPKIEFNNNPWYTHPTNNNSDVSDIWEGCKMKSRVGQYIVRKDVEDIDGDGDVLDPGEHKTHCYNLPSLVAALLGAFQKHAGDELLHSGISNGGIDLSDYATIVYVNEAIARAQLGVEEGEINLADYATIAYVDRGIGYMEDFTLTNCNGLNGLIMEKTNALDKRVTKLESGSGSDPGDGTIPEGDTITVKKIIGGNPAYGEAPKYVEIEDALAVKKIFHPEGDKSVEWESDMDVAGTLSVYQDAHISGDLHVYGQIINENSNGNLNTLNGVIEYIQSENSAMYLGDSFVCINDNTYLDGNLLVTGNLIGADTLENVKGIDVEEIYVDKITGRGTDTVPTVNFDSNIKVSGIVFHNGLVNNSDRSLKENIRYIDNLVKITNDDLLEKADLHDFIVNQVNICEYNFIGDTADKIGFIANDYEGTKVGDKIVSRYDNTLSYDVNNLLFATIGALQEEVRIKDEKIASLEARLAKIEEMLGINNN